MEDSVDLQLKKIVALKPFDYFTTEEGHIFILRFNNATEKYVLGALIYQKKDEKYYKIKSYSSFDITASSTCFDRNVFRIPYTQISSNVLASGMLGDKYLQHLFGNAISFTGKLIGSRLLFENESSDFDFVCSIKNLSAFNSLQSFLFTRPGIKLYKDNYFEDKAELYAKASSTTSQSLFLLTKHSLLYAFYQTVQREIAFFALHYNQEINYTFEQLLDILGSEKLRHIEIIGYIISDNSGNSFSFPRLFKVNTNFGIVYIYSLLWRTGGIELLQGYVIRIIGLRIDKETIFIDSNGFWEIVV